MKYPTPAKVGVFLLGLGDEFYVTDGQHRLTAIAQALQQKPELAEDSIGVTFIEEPDLDQIHQDFVDCAQSAKISPALLVEYDGREPLNRLTRLVSRDVQVLDGKIEKVGSVGKSSNMLFTSSQVKQGLMHALVGDWGMYATAMEASAHKKIGEMQGAAAVAVRVVKLFDEFAEHNEQWRKVRDAALSESEEVDIPGLRAKYLNFTGAGLLVISGVAHSILGDESEGWESGDLTLEQREQVERLATIDWAKGSDLWKGNLVGDQGNVTPHKPAVVLAVAKVKREIGIPLSEKEEGRIRSAEASFAVQPAPAMAV